MEAAELSYARQQPYEPQPVEVVNGDKPAAGASFSLTSPGRLGWLLAAITGRLVTSAAVANRTLTLRYDDGNGSWFYRSALNLVLPAGTTELFTFAANVGNAYNDGAGNAFAPLLPVEFQGGQKVALAVGAIDVADQLDQLVLTFVRRPYAPS